MVSLFSSDISSDWSHTVLLHFPEEKYSKKAVTFDLTVMKFIRIMAHESSINDSLLER